MIYEVESPPRQEVRHGRARKERAKDEMNVEGTKDRKNSIPSSGSKKCCRTDCDDNAQTGGCQPDPRSLHLSCLPRLRGVDPMR